MLKKNPKNNSTKTGAGRSNKENTLDYYNSILLEEVRSSAKIMIEAIEASRAAIGQKFDDLCKKMENRGSRFKLEIASLQTGIKAIH